MLRAFAINSLPIMHVQLLSLNAPTVRTFNDCGSINNVIDYVDEQEESDSLWADKIYAGIRLSNNLGKHFLKIDTISERSMKFQKDLRSRIPGYRDSYKQLISRLSPQKTISYFMVPKNKSIEIVSSNDESDF
ncbi:uncharacterized protein TNCV_2590431 [Trichonephila clavipes]|nr:uncharacterized protein TNCV_2590431 [Trichonephila clavipes]